MSELSINQSERLMADLRIVIADAEELLRTTAGEVSESTREARGRIVERLQVAKLNLGSLQDSALAKAKAAGVAADDYVHENPWMAIGAAAGVGLVVGLLVSRR